GKDYYSVQLLSGKSAAALQGSLAQLAGQPYARIDKRGAVYILRVGFWESREEAVQAAQALRPNFRNAHARIASYRPDAIVASAGEQPPGASSAPPPTRVAVPRPAPTTAPLTPPAADPAPSQAQVLNLRREAQSNLLPDPELHGIYPLPPPSESAPPPREITPPPSEATPSPPLRERRQRAQPSPPRGPNEAPLWNLLREERYAELETEVSRLRAEYPRWSPPARLLALRRDSEARRQITEAVDTKDWGKVVDFAQQYREQFTCNQIQFLWGLAEAHYSLGQTAQAIAVYERIIPGCPKTADRITTLQKAGNMLTAEVFAELVQREARGGRRDAAQQAQFNRIVYEFQLRELLQAISIKDRPRVTAIIETIERMPKAQRDGRYATMAGWFHIDAEQDETAVTWFETTLNWRPASEDAEDARHGLALAKFRMSRRSDAESVKLGVKRLDEAEAILARADPEDARNRTLLGDILFARAADAFSAKDYAQSLAYLEQSQAQGKSGRDVAMMHAWLHYQAGEDRQAADAFIDLYRAQQDRDIAEGIVFSLSRSGRWDELAGLADSLGGPLKEEAGPPFSQRFYFRKLFVASDAAAPGEFAELDNFAAPNITLGTMLRDKAGNDGTSALRVLKAPVLEGAVVINGIHEVRLQLDRVTLDSGSLPAGATVGTFPVAGAYVVAPTTRLANSVEPFLSYQHQGTLTTYAGIGMTPSGAAVSSAPVGNLGVT
ncbi:MAG: SPOR domain-containing protein, partial [Betaproteobacteria bacterium]|nr:SPOR domain-containing protein [Betaproteobacteria bacterium]